MIITSAKTAPTDATNAAFIGEQRFDECRRQRCPDAAVVVEVVC